mmetsp:Transcript_10513/g.31683  ORF Transcript_10513/g.31683 Transcript_10513/m.31683 type:complete len:277 (+) Transcript_10513:626-1456(+)
MCRRRPPIRGGADLLPGLPGLRRRRPLREQSVRGRSRQDVIAPASVTTARRPRFVRGHWRVAQKSGARVRRRGPRAVVSVLAGPPLGRLQLVRRHCDDLPDEDLSLLPSRSPIRRPARRRFGRRQRLAPSLAPRPLRRPVPRLPLPRTPGLLQRGPRQGLFFFHEDEGGKRRRRLGRPALLLRRHRRHLRPRPRRRRRGRRPRPSSASRRPPRRRLRRQRRRGRPAGAPRGPAPALASVGRPRRRRLDRRRAATPTAQVATATAVVDFLGKWLLLL